ncbi:MAG: Asp-tRNA(Asn)/Glu-tRNA(Gln) amidotransferase GatCAB subunit A [Chloroflexi bacterium]|nr:Asp-tRNA(Asn)/Glu-tRNA(Gln) amidotransferase GatCAB subunit A [Chloroflexota bacterium]|tara:strand:- start:765 stop:2225 length:1461 start_codon:yes stop_codon:yes gene_type:complete
MNKFNNLSTSELSNLIKSREISSEELVKASLSDINSKDKKINSFITINEDLSVKEAKKIDKALKNNEMDHKFLTGIPIMLKDNISTKGIKTTAGSKILENYIPPYDAHVTKKIIKNGGIIIGKGNLDEFAMGSSNETSFFGSVKNPWDLDRVPGGSSGGPAAAVSAGLVSCSLGSDTGGSIRQPAALCGVTGMKPTYGLVSRYGLIAFGSSLDQIGPIAKSAKDCGEILNIISGKDPYDSTSFEKNFLDFNSIIENDINGKKIGVPTEYLENCDKEIKEAFKKSLLVYENLGAEIIEISLPLTDYALDVYYIIAPSEASSNLSRFDGVKYGFRSKSNNNSRESLIDSRTEGFGDEVKRRIMIGTYTLSAGYYDAYYKKAQQIRTLIINEFNNRFKEVDVILTPTAPSIAFKLNEKTDDPIKMYQSDLCTIPVNIAGLPAISIQGGFVNKMPVGLQIIGPQNGDQTILQFANKYQENTEWHKNIPNL